MRTSGRRLRVAAGMVVVTLLCAQAAAQTGGTLQGRVVDTQGLALPGATVTLTNVETGWARTDITDDQGWYRAPVLPPGIYAIRAELSGFAPALNERVPLTLGQELTVNLTLKVATLQETVTVTAASP